MWVRIVVAVWGILTVILWTALMAQARGGV